jgi:subtilisin family serine protease
VEPVWKQGLTGKGVVVTVVDDGIEHDHPDLKDNYDAAASWDMNGNDPDPYPNEADPINSHGTRCCGQIAMARDNNVCGVGIAYEAKIGAVRMLDGDVTDSIEARSLSLNPNHIMIYTNSWGPNDDGRTMEGPGPLTRAALKAGVERGRNGLGSIYLFANGNGGGEDDCNMDGYSNSIYTIAIGAAASDGSSPWYAERCSATMAVTYSSGGGGQPAISTVDLHHGCTSAHTGTSAASPMAAGILALVLEANPRLTWRDMQHLIARTSEVTAAQDPDWVANAAGLHVNHKFGFGNLNTEKLITLARTWTSVGPQVLYQSAVLVPSDKKIPLASSRSGALSQYLDITEAMTSIHHLEHVQVVVDASTVTRGSLVFELVSPGGTSSTLLHTRPRDHESGSMQWTFLTVRHWNESPMGRWALHVYSALGARGSRLNSWQLVLRGT